MSTIFLISIRLVYAKRRGAYAYIEGSRRWTCTVLDGTHVQRTSKRRFKDILKSSRRLWDVFWPSCAVWGVVIFYRFVLLSSIQKGRHVNRSTFSPSFAGLNTNNLPRSRPPPCSKTVILQRRLLLPRPPETSLQTLLSAMNPSSGGWDSRTTDDPSPYNRSRTSLLCIPGTLPESRPLWTAPLPSASSG